MTIFGNGDVLIGDVFSLLLLPSPSRRPLTLSHKSQKQHQAKAERQRVNPHYSIMCTGTEKKNESHANKDFGNPVQVNAEDTLTSRMTRHETDAQKEDKAMREKTAHIGFKASHASQGDKVDNADHPTSK